MSGVIEAAAAALTGSTLGTDLFLQFMPDTPDLCTALYEYDGMPPDETMGAGTVPAIEKPRLQVKCRAAKDDYPAARDRVKAARALLCAVHDQTLSGLYVLRFEPTGSTMHLGSDDKARPLVVANFQVWHL